MILKLYIQNFWWYWFELLLRDNSVKEDFKWKQFLEWVKVLVTQSCPILWHSMDYSPPGSSVHRILHTRILGWSLPRDWTHVLLHRRQILYHLSFQGFRVRVSFQTRWLLNCYCKLFWAVNLKQLYLFIIHCCDVILFKKIFATCFIRKI